MQKAKSLYCEFTMVLLSKAAAAATAVEVLISAAAGAATAVEVLVSAAAVTATTRTGQERP